MMWKYFSEKRTKKWIEQIENLVHNYNNTHHRSIKMTPMEASNTQHESTVYKILYFDTLTKNSQPKFNLGDRVRISKFKQVFTKGYIANYTQDIFVISEV